METVSVIILESYVVFSKINFGLAKFTSLLNFYFSTGDISTRRLKLWEESFEELLSDLLGRETLQRFLDKEYSGENLRFFEKVTF